ncbi:MAG: hypothetical protein HYV75_01470 [Opitutae bacterium]|nr:hypothetical protein [Opitutae bacterium]
MLGAATAARAALPDYVREALGRFSAELPPHWAFTTTTVRAKVSTAERYDPAKPPGEQWTLLRYNGRTPEAKELAKYQKLRAANPSPASSASFNRGDIDPGSLRLRHEDGERAEFEGGFREASAGADKMLRYLQLRLTVNKRVPHVERYTLRLREPYTPILGVKMNELRVVMTFTPPAPDRPSLPAACTSHFRGRIFFIGTQEDLRVTYSDFAPSGQRPAAAAAE